MSEAEWVTRLRFNEGFSNTPKEDQDRGFVIGHGMQLFGGGETIKLKVGKRTVSVVPRQVPYGSATYKALYAHAEQLASKYGWKKGATPEANGRALEAEFQARVAKAETIATRASETTKIPLSGAGREVVVELAYMSGAGGLSGFKRMFVALAMGDADGAAKEIIDSALPPNRAAYLAQKMRSADMERPAMEYGLRQIGDTYYVGARALGTFATREEAYKAAGPFLEAAGQSEDEFRKAVRIDALRGMKGTLADVGKVTEVLDGILAQEPYTPEALVADAADPPVLQHALRYVRDRAADPKIRERASMFIKALPAALPVAAPIRTAGDILTLAAEAAKQVGVDINAPLRSASEAFGHFIDTMATGVPLQKASAELYNDFKRRYGVDSSGPGV